jgi:hypothetical protein
MLQSDERTHPHFEPRRKFLLREQVKLTSAPLWGAVLFFRLACAARTHAADLSRTKKRVLVERCGKIGLRIANVYKAKTVKWNVVEKRAVFSAGQKIKFSALRA